MTRKFSNCFFVLLSAYLSTVSLADKSLCCENVDYSTTDYLHCSPGSQYSTAPINNCATCVAYQCIDWTFGSAANAAREAAFFGRTGQQVYFGVGSHTSGLNPNNGGLCYRITTNNLARDLIVQVVNKGDDVPIGNVDLQTADGGFGLFDACTKTGTTMPQFNSTATPWGV